MIDATRLFFISRFVAKAERRLALEAKPDCAGRNGPALSGQGIGLTAGSHQ